MLRHHRRFGWINRDGKLIIAVRGVRTFAHSAASVLLAIYLDLQGFGLFEIGLFLLYGIVGTAAVSLGALAAGLPAAFQRVFGLDQMTAFQVVFGGYVLLSLIAA